MKSKQNAPKPRVVTTKTVLTMKQTGEKIAMLTAYDYLMAKYLDQVGIDIILVGDSLGNVVQGYETTLPVTVDDMIYHAKAVKRAVKNALIVVDMPFMSFQTSIDDAVRNAGRIMKEVGVGAVKLEGGADIAEIVRHLVKVGIPVMGHLGLTPQAINKFGTYEVRAQSKEEAEELINDAKVLAKAGVFAIVLEKIPASLARRTASAIPGALRSMAAAVPSGVRSRGPKPVPPVIRRRPKSGSPASSPYRKCTSAARPCVAW